MPDLLFFLLLGHFCGDYAFQTDRMAQRKRQSRAVLSFHVAIYTLTVGAFWFVGRLLRGELRIATPIMALVLAGLYLQHWIQDYLKAFRGNGSKQSYYLDQALHVLVLYLIRIFI